MQLDKAQLCVKATQLLVCLVGYQNLKLRTVSLFAFCLLITIRTTAAKPSFLQSKPKQGQALWKNWSNTIVNVLTYITNHKLSGLIDPRTPDISNCTRQALLIALSLENNFSNQSLFAQWHRSSAAKHKKPHNQNFKNPWCPSQIKNLFISSHHLAVQQDLALNPDTKRLKYYPSIRSFKNLSSKFQ